MTDRIVDKSRENIGTGLVELLVVLGLMGVMAGGAVPGAHRIRQEWTLWGGARLVESSLLWARGHAITANDSLTFIIDPGGRCFYWLSPDGSRYESSVRYLPSGVSIVKSPAKPLRFFQHGNAVPAGTFVIEGEAGLYRVVVSALGRVRVVRDR